MNAQSAALWVPPLDELRLFAPELVLLATLVLLLVVPLFAGRRRELAAGLVLIGALVGLVVTNGTLAAVDGGGRGALSPQATITPMLIADGYGLFFKLLLFAFLALIVWLWWNGAEGGGVSAGQAVVAERGTVEFFVLLLTSALGMMLMVSTLNMLVLMIAVETASLTSYAVTASNKRSRAGAEAGLKYVTFGATSAAVMAYGVSLLYGRFGTLDLGEIAARAAHIPIPADPVFWLAFLAFLLGILFKIAAVPMHLWCPDVFEGAPIEVTTWLSVASKAAGLGLLLRIVDAFRVADPLSLPATSITWAVGIVAAVTCTVGNLAALRQESVKRILAYSSIAHAGYMMMAAAILIFPGGADKDRSIQPAMSAVVAYLGIYLLMNVGAFGVTAAVAWRTGSDHLTSFTALGRRAPWLAFPMAVCLFSLVGLPPLGGFTAKWYLLLALGRSASAQPWLWVLVLVAVINTAISLFYYVRVIRQMYLVEDDSQAAFRAAPGGLVLANACALLLILAGTIGFSTVGQVADRWTAAVYRPGTHPVAAGERGVPGDRKAVWGVVSGRGL